MIFWLLALALVAVVVLFTLLPMMRAGEDGDSLEFARNFYREREAELKAQLEAGEIDNAAFEAALAEQGRRLIALARVAPGEGAGPQVVARRRKLAALMMLVLVPAIGLGSYLVRGRPGMSDEPLVARAVAPKDFDLATAIEKIEAHLARNPDDGRGFEVVAPVYMKAGNFDKAAQAWRRVIALLGETARRQADLGEALVAAQDGAVGAEARTAFEAALRLEPAMPKARYYLALALEQDGKKAMAVAALEALRADLPESAARTRVEADLTRLKGTPASPAAEALAALPEKERAQAIGGMVDALAERLEQKGGSPDDWAKLVRARLVLGQKDLALAALEKAKSDLKDKVEGASAIEALKAMIDKAP